MASDFDRRRFAAQFGAPMEQLTRRAYPQGTPPRPNPYGGDWAPGIDEITRWGSAIRLSNDTKNMPDITPGDDFQALLDVPLPLPLPVSIQVLVRDTILVGAPIGIPWTVPVWVRVSWGVGRGALVMDEAISPPANPPPAGTFPRQQLWVPAARGQYDVNGGQVVSTFISAQHVRVEVKFLTPGAGETLDVYAGLSVVA